MKIAICTNFQDWNPGYSLTGIVSDQVEMLTRYGHEVHVLTSSMYNMEYDPGVFEEEKCHVHHIVPFGHLIDYKSVEDWTEEHKKLSRETAKTLGNFIHEKGIDVVFTHDWIFTGWNMPYGLGLRMIDNKDVRYLHWIHSVPSIMSDWWDIQAYGDQHKIIFPNETDRLRVAEQFRGSIEHVRAIPHIKDLRTFYEFHPDTIALIDEYPGIMQSDFVQIYPASADRLFAKRVEIIIWIMASLKKRGFTVCLVVANQWATGRAPRENCSKYHQIAREAGLTQEEFIFTSEWETYHENSTEIDETDTRVTRFARGITRRMLRELNLCGNLFVFPTREESFGLVGPEAALGGAFLVLNRSLPMMGEVYGNQGLYFDFGSFTNEAKHQHEERELWYQVATVILGRCFENELFRTRTWCRKKYNYDYLYINHYEPVLEEITWDKSKS